MSNKEKWKVLYALVPGIALIFTDTSVVPVALPTIQREFHASSLELQWMVNAYLLVMAVLVLAGGKLGDYIGRRQNFILGMGVFALASLFCGLSGTGTQLILARAFQGVGAAMMVPMNIGIISAIFPAEKRGGVIGITMAIGSLFLSLGPLIGGFFTEYLSWRYAFWINLPVAAFGIICAFLYIPQIKGEKEKVDFLGFTTYSLGIFCLIFGLMQAREWGWTDTIVILFLVLGALFLSLLYFTEKRTKNPFIDFSLYRNRIFFGSALSLFFTQFFIMITVFWAIYFQSILFYSPFQAGAITIISTFPVIFIAPIAGKLTDRFHPLIPISLGYLFFFFTFLWLAIFSGKVESFWILLPGLVTFGAGITLILTPSSSIVAKGLPENKMGNFSGMLNVLRSLGSTFGVAIIGSFLLNTQYMRFADNLHKNPSTKNLHPETFEELLAKSSRAEDAMRGLSKSVQREVENELFSSEVFGYIVTNGVSAAIVLLVYFGVFFTLRKVRIKSSSDPKHP